MPAWHEATWVDPDGKSRRRWRWGWLALLLIPAALVAFSIARFNDYWQYVDMTVTTMQCPQPVPESAAWADLEAAGCTEVDGGATVALLDAGRPVKETQDGAVWTYEGVPSAFSTLGINVTTPETAGRVYVVDAETTPPTVLMEMSSTDTADRVWTGNIGSVSSATFYAVIAPPE